MNKEEAIKILRELHDKVLFSERTALETLHPELKESEDEKIRKFLIKWIQDNYYHGTTEIPTKTLIGWLEKQGEHKKFRDSIQVGDEVTRNSDGVIVNLSQLNRVAKKDEKQSETFTKKDVDDAFVEGMALAKNELEKQGEKKSSDEVLKIRQELYQSGYNDGYKHGCEDTKKQGEQKSSDEDMKEALRTEYEKGRADAFAQMQKEWSEEDEAYMCDVIAFLEDARDCRQNALDCINWVKSIKERIGGKL